MTTLVLLILGAVWAAVLIPPALRARAEASPGDSIGHFHKQLNVLRRTGGLAPVPGKGGAGTAPVGALVTPASSSPVSQARRRRRDVLVTFLWAMGGTLALGILPSFRGLLLLHLLVDLAFAAYVVLLLRFKRQEAERAAADRAKKVRPLRPVPAGVTDLALRRAAGH